MSAGIRRVKRSKRLRVRIGNWLTVDQSKTLLGGLPADHVRGKCDRAIRPLLIGRGLRRAELVGLGTQDFQVREERWVITDLIGKGLVRPTRRLLAQNRVARITESVAALSMALCLRLRRCWLRSHLSSSRARRRHTGPRRSTAHALPTLSCRTDR